MAVVNVIGLLEDSPFRSTDRVPLPKDPAIEAQAEEEGKDSSDDEEGAKSPKSQELS